MEQSKYIAMPFAYKLARFSMLLRKAYPFLGELCMRVEKYHNEQHALAATDGLRLYLNVPQLNNLPEECLNFILLHELFHIILRHRYPKEMPFYAKMYWNLGFDLVINWMLMDMSSELSRNGIPIIPHSAFALTTDDLSKDNSEMISTAFVNQAVVQGITGQDPPLLVQVEWKSFSATVINDGSFVFDLLDGVDIEDFPSDADVQNLLASCAKSAGKSGLPRHLQGLWEELRKGRALPWHLILKHYLEDMQESADYDFSPPDKRMLYSGSILPSETFEEENRLNNALIVLDVSGSVDKEELLAQIHQVDRVLKAVEVSGTIISFGTTVYQEAVLKSRGSLKNFINQLEVGGGTNWGDVVKYVKERNRNAKPIIVFTDGYFCSYEGGLSNVIFITQRDYPSHLNNLGKVIHIK